jgi:hypothetical protein
MHKDVTLVVVETSTRTSVLCCRKGVGVESFCGVSPEQEDDQNKSFRINGKGTRRNSCGDLGFWEFDHLCIGGRQKDAMEDDWSIRFYPTYIEWVWKILEAKSSLVG